MEYRVHVELNQKHMEISYSDALPRRLEKTIEGVLNTHYEHMEPKQNLAF